MNPKTESPVSIKPVRHRILSLDGGGAKGVYSLGFLMRLEKDVGKPLHEFFDLFYGTSTGSIIATLLSLGIPVDKIYELYLNEILPAVELVKSKKQGTTSNAPPPNRPAADIPAPDDNVGEST